MPTIGSSVGPYRVLDLLGEGGMGSVYLAEDTRLGRRVALKVLALHARGDEQARRRLLREARTIAGLRHPSLCAVHDVIEAEGLDILVLEHLEGRTLRERLASSPLPAGEACTLAIQIAEGLCAAHDQGIVHRDLKPGNVMVGPGGRAVVMDFGLARGAGDSQLTRTGTVMGTVAYMAPEQVRGESADHRADIWALGAVLYEMLAGRPPFQADHEQALVYGILNREPPPLTAARPELPGSLDRIVSRALTRDRDRRYQSCRELLDDLRTARQELITAGGPGLPAHRAAGDRRRRPRLLASLIAGGLLAAAAVAFFLLRGTAPAVIDSVAVLPFANFSGDPAQEYIADGVTEALIMELSKIRKLRVISRTSVMQYKDARGPLPEIARRLGVQGVIEGSAVRVGDRLRITAQLIEAASDRHLWAQEYDRDYGDLLGLQKEVAKQIAQAVRIELDPAERALLSGGATASVEVQDAYLRGLQIISSLQIVPRLEEAISHFEAALALDPGYAPAQTGVALGHVFRSLAGARPSAESMPQARLVAQKALELDPDQAQAHTVLGYVSMTWDWDWERSGREFLRALELSPGEVTTRHGYSDHLLLMGLPEESLDQIRTALLNDPASPMVAVVWVNHLFLAGHYDEALEEAARLEELNPRLPLRNVRAETLWMLGRHREAVALWSEGFDGDPEALEALERGGTAAGPRGALGELARLMAARYRSGARHREPSTLFAMAGLADSSLAWLEALADVRDISLFHKLAGPATAPFARHPRYEALLRRIKLPDDAIARLTSRSPV